MSPEFDLAEAYWRIEWLTPSRAQSAALDAVAAGYDCAALYELLDGGFGTAAETYQIFARALAELNRPPLSPEQAAIRIARSVASAITSGKLSPSAGAQWRWHELWEADDMPDALLPLVNLAESYDMYFGITPAPEYLTEVVAAAQMLLVETGAEVDIGATGTREPASPPVRGKH